MRKCSIMVLCLLLISASAIVWAHASINSEKDNVTLSETVLYGDRSEAENLSVTTHICQSGHLFWDTTLKTGDENLIDTDFRFTQKEENNFPDFDYGVTVEATGSCGYSAGDIEYDLLPETAQFAADHTQNGEYHSETVNLKDFYDFFPLRIIVDIKGFNYYSDDVFATEANAADEIKEEFLDYFRFPIEEDFLYDIAIQKDAEGRIISYEGNPAETETFWLTTLSTVTDDACYFTFDLSSWPGIDTSMIKGGYGIYRLPLSVIEEQDTYFGTVSGETEIYPENLSTVYQLDENIEIIDFKASEKHDELILTTLENGFYRITVLDASTGRELQKIQAMQQSADGDGFYQTFYYDDFMAIKDIDNRFAVIEINDDGEFIPVITTHPFEADLSTIITSASGLAWDGEKLAFASYIYEEYPSESYENSYYLLEKCGFYLLVLNEEGVLYAGKYDSSLDINSNSLTDHGWESINYYDYTRPREDIPITLKWN